MILVGGTSSDGAAGLAIDLAVARALGEAPRLMVTAVTAQDETAVEAITLVTPEMLGAQRAVLARRPVRVVKTGMLGGAAAVAEVAKLMEGGGAELVVDPVMAAGSGGSLLDEAGQRALRRLVAGARLMTPNRPEAQALLGHAIDDIPTAAGELLSWGAHEVLIKGGHTDGDFCDDYWTDGARSLWLRSPRRPVGRTHGTGCALATAIAAGLAQGMSSPDALTRAKALGNRRLRRGLTAAVEDWPHGVECSDMPWVPELTEAAFADCGGPLGFYPIVDRAAWLARLLPRGVTTIQLRVKDLNGEALRREISDAVRLAHRFGARLFINDYWELALAAGAYGVHLGQGDLGGADLRRLARAGLRLGVSTHGYAEVARAHGIRPSYLAVGPIFPTTLKAMPYPPQGISALSLWRALVPYPLVAIGGLTLEHAEAARDAGADGIAVVSDLMRASDPEGHARKWVVRLQR